MGSVNKVILVGQLGADPELKYTSEQRAVCSLRVATNKVSKDKATGEKQKKTEWHRVNAWGDTAENCQKYLTKSSSVYIEGELHTRSWEKDGQKHYATEIMADKVVFMDGGPRRESAESQPMSKTAPAHVPQDRDDDMPF